MQNVISLLLKALIVENNRDTDELIIKSFKDAFTLLLENKDSLFEGVIDRTSYDMSDKSAEVDTIYFDGKGVLLYDFTYSKSANKKLYIYRSNGIRIFLMDSGAIEIYTPHSYISSDTCSFYHDGIDSSGLKYIDNIDDIKNILTYMCECDDLSIIQKTLMMITSIKEKYPRGYFIEQFIYPPDMNILSKLSKSIKNKLWDTLLSKEFTEEYQVRDIEIAMGKLLEIDIQPTFNVLINFINNNINSDVAHIKKVVEHINSVSLSEVRANVKELKSKQDDVVLLRPGLFGFSINLRAFWRWCKSL